MHDMPVENITDDIDDGSEWYSVVNNMELIRVKKHNGGYSVYREGGEEVSSSKEREAYHSILDNVISFRAEEE